MKEKIADVLTSIRILVSGVLLFCPVFSSAFYVLYLVGGLSDMSDGIIARKTNTVSEFGSKFDSAADFVFVTVCLIRILPAMDIPTWLYVWTAVIALIKFINIISDSKASPWNEYHNIIGAPVIDRKLCLRHKV